MPDNNPTTYLSYTAFNYQNNLSIGAIGS